jgi:small-conductance mechanosensitive channel
MKLSQVLVAVTAIFAAASTQAASPAETAIAAIGTEAAALGTAAWPVVIGVVTGFIGMKLFKKFANRAT